MVSRQNGDTTSGPRRGRQNPRPTDKQEQLNKDALEKMLRKMQRLEKENASLKKGARVHDSDRSPHPEDEDDYESEERDDGGQYESALTDTKFQSLGVINQPSQSRSRIRRLRREGDSPQQQSDRQEEESAASERDEDGSGGQARRHHDKRLSELAASDGPSSPSPAPRQPRGRENPRKRTRSPSPDPGSETQDGLDEDGLDENQARSPNEDDRRDMRAPARKKPRFRHDKTPSGNPKVSDYEPSVSHLILKAIRIFESRILTENPFPSDEEQERWATEAWDEVQPEDSHEQYRLPARVRGLITERTSRPRGALRDKIRPLIISIYGFSDKGDEDAKKSNYLLYQKLMHVDELTHKPDPIFHYADPDAQQGYARSAAIFQAIRDAWFPRTGIKLGVLFPSRFRPIRMVSLALVCTAIHFCLDEWADGTYNKLEFSETDYDPVYKRYKAKVDDWREIDPEKVDKILSEMYDEARRASGVPMEESDDPDGLAPDVRELARRELEA